MKPIGALVLGLACLLLCQASRSADEPPAKAQEAEPVLGRSAPETAGEARSLADVAREVKLNKPPSGEIRIVGRAQVTGRTFEEYLAALAEKEPRQYQALIALMRICDAHSGFISALYGETAECVTFCMGRTTVHETTITSGTYRGSGQSHGVVDGTVDVYSATGRYQGSADVWGPFTSQWTETGAYSGVTEREAHINHAETPQCKACTNRVMGEVTSIGVESFLRRRPPDRQVGPSRRPGFR